VTQPDQQATAVGGEALQGRYEILAPISSGAMGAVYRARDRESGKDVAVKRLLDVRHAARFEIEARLLASLSHPRVVKVIDHSSDEQGLYIVMDLVKGTDLGVVLKKDGDPGLILGDAIEYARHACEALQYVHGQQIVHRDVKPQNMILSGDGVILVDFGVARMLGGEEDQGTVAVGTPRYMAPEVFAGGTVSAASDIFSLAATLWTMVIGAPPRYGDTLKLEKIAPSLSPELKHALVGGLEMLPEQRIPSAAAFAEAIGVPLTADRGQSLAQSLGRGTTRRRVMEAIVRTAAGMFEAAACSIALIDAGSGDLVYEAAWGAGAAEVVGLRLPPGAGLAGTVVQSGEAVAVPECRKDPRFAAQVAAKTGYVPYTMLVTPLVKEGRPIGVLSLLDRRDGGPYRHEDLARAALFADLAVVALDLDTFPMSTTGGRTLPLS
jgi:eukaryotic-like serine/threonine-protein kinase